MTYTLELQKKWRQSPIENAKQSQEFLNDLTHGKVAVFIPKKNSEFNQGELYRENFYFFADIKKRILECFKFQELKLRSQNSFDRFDCLEAQVGRVRKLPGSIQREGSYVDPKCILMPSFINLGAYVNEGTMVDTWATVGSCAYIGSNVHLSGGVGIGGVLEPAQAKPVVIEDNCFIGSRAAIVEGCYIGTGSVIAAGVSLTTSTKIFDLTGDKEKELEPGFIPPYSVVISGTRPFKLGFHAPCALIIKTRDTKTDLKVSLNDALRATE